MQPLVVRIRFNDPELIQEGLCQFTSGHDNHVHVDIAPPAPIKPARMAVMINGTPSGVPAFLAENVTWVGCRDLTIALRPFGTSTDHVVAEGGAPFAITVSVKSAQHELAGIQLGGVGYVRSRDLEPLYSVPFNFVMGSAPRLEIS
jgi:hypothetical protein